MTRFRNPKPSHIGSTQPCKACGASFVKDHGRRVTCSLGCQRIIRTGVSLKYQARCAWCDKPTTQAVRDFKRGFRPTCSSLCVSGLAMLARGTTSSSWSPPKPGRERTIWPSCWITSGKCSICSEPFTSRYTVMTCSAECARKNRRADNHKFARHYEYRRRSQTVVTFEGIIDWRRISARDGSACYLCGYDTDANDYMRRLGSDGREAFIAGLEYPSLDHVIPLSKGGAHSMSNARLAHTYCNSIKSNHVA